MRHFKGVITHCCDTLLLLIVWHVRPEHVLLCYVFRLSNNLKVLLSVQPLNNGQQRANKPFFLYGIAAKALEARAKQRNNMVYIVRHTSLRR